MLCHTQHALCTRSMGIIQAFQASPQSCLAYITVHPMAVRTCTCSHRHKHYVGPCCLQQMPQSLLVTLCRLHLHLQDAATYVLCRPVLGQQKTRLNPNSCWHQLQANLKKNVIIPSWAATHCQLHRQLHRAELPPD